MRPQHLARDAHAANIILEIAPDLQLDMGEAGVDRLLAKATQLVVVVAEPARRGGVAGIAVLLELADARRLARLLRRQQGKRLVRRDTVGEVAEIDAAHQLLRRHIGDQPPQRLLFRLRPQIPYRVDHRAGRQMNGAFIRPDPAQLAVAGDIAPELPHIGGDRFQLAADDQVLQRADRCAANLVAAPDGKGQAVPADRRVIRFDNDVGGRVVGVRVHRVRTVEMIGRGKTDIFDAQ